MKKQLTEEEKLKKATYQKAYREKPENKIKKKERESTPRYKEQAKDYHKKYREDNKEQLKEKNMLYNSTPEAKQKSLERARKYRSTPEGAAKELARNSSEKYKEREAVYKKEYRKKNREILNQKQREYQKTPEVRLRHKERMESDPQYALVYHGKHRRRKALNAQSADKKFTYNESLGCTPDAFKKHIESLFLEGMTWQNHGTGKGKWHLDEIRPCASFNLSDPEQYKACFHYTNCQPLWSEDNIKKSSWWNGKKHKHTDHKNESDTTTS
jgi:hypothetical protein